jgi:hypothetical protein
MVACFGGIDLADYGRAKLDGPGRWEAADGHSDFNEGAARNSKAVGGVLVPTALP